MKQESPLSRLIALLLVFVMLACGGDASPTEPAREPVASVTVSPPQGTIVEGATLELHATPRDGGGAPLDGRAVTWRSTATAVATVNASSGVVQAVSAGTAQIIATSEAREGSATITVTPIRVAQVDLSESTVALAWNGSATVQATARAANGQVLDNRVVIWTSSDEGVATVSNTGVIDAKSEGSATITAAVDDKSATVSVRVNPAPVARVVLSATTLVLETGDAQSIDVTLEDPLGRVLTGRMVMWASSAPAAIDVVAGTVRGLAEGAGVVTASSEGVSATANVSVLSPPAEDLIYDRAIDTGGFEIVTLSLLAGSTPQRINAGNVSRQPSPDPLGERLVFAVTQPHPQTNELMNDLYIVNRNGLSMKQFTTVPEIETDPAWSPDGQRIAFAGTNATNGHFDIHVMNVDGTGLVNLTAAMGASVNEMHPAWSRDGQFLAFIAMADFGLEPRIWIIGADGTGLRQLTTDAGYDQRPTWSPNGDRIAFERSGGGPTGSDIMVIDAQGGTPTRLAIPGQQYQPAWSADGRYLAYVNRDPSTNNRTEIYTMRPDGTAQRRRTTDPAWGGGTFPKWIKR